jgi:hypothetical protein
MLLTPPWPILRDSALVTARRAAHVAAATSGDETNHPDQVCSRATKVLRLGDHMCAFPRCALSAEGDAGCVSVRKAISHCGATDGRTARSPRHEGYVGAMN